MSLYENENKWLLKLARNYLQGNLAFSLLPEDAKEMTWDRQSLFLEATIHNKLLKKYPVNDEFSKLYFKKIIQLIEPHQEIHDDFYTFLCSVMKIETGNGFRYRHYVINEELDNIITIKETNNMVVNGTTGMRTWEAALMLADWALCNQEITSNKNILELGSGVGFTGITIAKLCQVSSMVMTDCHNDVLRTIHENAAINLPDLKENNKGYVFKNIHDAQTNLEVTTLDWNDVDSIRSDLIPDIIIGADIVYDPSILQPLCNVINIFCDRNQQLAVYIASVIRNNETFSAFLDALDANNLNHENINLKSIKVEWNDQKLQRSFLKITRNQ